MGARITLITTKSPFESFRVIGGYAGYVAACLIADGKMPGQLTAEGLEKLNMARGRKKADNTQALKLAEALTFISVANRDTGEGPWQKHVVFGGNMVKAFDGLIYAGHPIEEDLACCPHGAQLRTAIKKCGAALNVSLLETGRLSVKGDSFRALVPCMSAGDMPDMEPDPQVAAIDNRLKVALGAVGVLINEAETEVVKAAALLQANTALATDKAAALEVWHGIDLPPSLVIPKLFIQAIVKQAKDLSGFGWSYEQVEGAWRARSITFWFDDGAWIKTLCYADPYPAETLQGILNVQSFPVDVPPKLIEGIEAVKTFNETETVVFMENKVQSHFSEATGAQYDVPGLPPGKQFDADKFEKLAPYMAKVDLTTFGDRAFFFGNAGDLMARGVIMGIRSNEPSIQETAEQTHDPST